MQDFLSWNSQWVISYIWKHEWTACGSCSKSIRVTHCYCSNDAPSVRQSWILMTHCLSELRTCISFLLTALEERERARELWHALKSGKFAQRLFHRDYDTTRNWAAKRPLSTEISRQSISLADPQQTHMKQFFQIPQLNDGWTDFKHLQAPQNYKPSQQASRWLYFPGWAACCEPPSNGIKVRCYRAAGKAPRPH